MVYITGDTHRNFSRVVFMCRTFHTSKEDVLIILGDAGINGFGTAEDRQVKRMLSRLPITLFCIHGNHEERPQNVSGYAETVWHGGAVFMEAEYPSLLFAKDGEIYNFGGRHCLVIGGAYSVDKHYRLALGRHWWPDEQPSDNIKARVEQRLENANWRVDVVLSHTCPLRYEPTEVFLPGVDQSTVDKSTEEWLGAVESRLQYDEWYCGHFHTGKQIDKLTFLFQEIQMFSFGE